MRTKAEQSGLTGFVMRNSIFRQVSAREPQEAEAVGELVQH